MRLRIVTHCFLLVFCWICVISIPALGQEGENTFINPDTRNDIDPLSIGQSPMENVFFNTVWGSLVGGTLALSVSFLNDAKPSEERFSFSQSSETFVQGATYGGFAGLLIGFYLALNDIEFRENDLISSLTFAPAVIDTPLRIVTVETPQDTVVTFNFTF